MKKEKPPEEFTVRCDIYDTFLWVFLVIFSTLSPILQYEHNTRTFLSSSLRLCAPVRITFVGTFRSLLIGFHSVGNFEDFKALGALLELNIDYCKKIDCKNALEVLPTMPWAAQIQKLILWGTDVEGTAGTFFF